MKEIRLTSQQFAIALKLAEEAGEVVQATMKLLQHGPSQRHPVIRADVYGAGLDTTNAMDLEREIGDVLAAADLLALEHIISLDRIAEQRRLKFRFLWERGIGLHRPEP